MKFLTFSLSKAGGRQANEDCCAYVQLADRACWLVADGLGGHNGGAVASRLAVEVFCRSFRETPALSEEAFRTCMEAAEAEIVKAQEDYRLSSMRSTLVGVVTDYRTATWGYAGDSRLYIFRRGALLYQTEDHSIPQSLAKAGMIKPEEIRHHEDRNRLLKALGRGNVNPSICTRGHVFQEGDAMLLCTDGFWEHVLENEMESVLRNVESPEAWLGGLEEILLSRVTGDHDNYTGIAVFVA